MLDSPQTITITQGDGKTAEITLYSTDTMSEVAAKINDAIAGALGQGRYADNISKFCTIENISGNGTPVYTRGYAREADGTLVLDGNGNPIETGEKEPTPAKLRELVNQANQDKVKTIFIQPEFPASGAKRVAEAIGGKTVYISVLEYDVPANLRKTAAFLEESFKE